MDYLTDEHQFFSKENMQKIVKQIDSRILSETGETIQFAADGEMARQMIQAAKDFPAHLITADPQEGIDKLNDIVMRRAVRALTVTEEAGQYVPGNYFYRQTRRTRREESGLEEPTRHGASVILGGNVFKKRNDVFQREQGELRERMVSEPYDDRFAGTRPRRVEFREML